MSNKAEIKVNIYKTLQTEWELKRKHSEESGNKDLADVYQYLIDVAKDEIEMWQDSGE